MVALLNAIKRNQIGGAYGRFSDYPSLSMPRVHVLLRLPCCSDEWCMTAMQTALLFCLPVCCRCVRPVAPALLLLFAVVKTGDAYLFSPPRLA